MRNPPALALQRKMMLLSWQERSRWPQEQKGELFVNPSLPPHLIAGASPVMLFVPQNGRVCPSSEAAPVTLCQGRGQQGSPAGTAPSCPGHLPVPSLLDCWEAREAPETFPSVSYLVAEPRTAFWVETWNPLYAILPLHWSCPSLISRLPFSLRKQLLFKPVFLAQFCGWCCWGFFLFLWLWFFFPLRTSCVWAVQYCPLMLYMDFRENFPTSVMPHHSLFWLRLWFFAFCIWLQLCHAMRKLNVWDNHNVFYVWTYLSDFHSEYTRRLMTYSKCSREF